MQYLLSYKMPTLLSTTNLHFWFTTKFCNSTLKNKALTKHNILTNLLLEYDHYFHYFNCISHCQIFVKVVAKRLCFHPCHARKVFSQIRLVWSTNGWRRCS